MVRQLMLWFQIIYMQVSSPFRNKKLAVIRSLKVKFDNLLNLWTEKQLRILVFVTIEE